MRSSVPRLSILAALILILALIPSSLRAQDDLVRFWLDGNIEGVQQALQNMDPSEATKKGPGSADIRSLNQAVVFLYQGQALEAQRSLRPLLEAWPRWIEARRLDARIQEELDPVGTLKAYEALLDSPKADSWDYFRAAPHFMKAGSLGSGVSYYAQAVRRDKDLYYGWLGLGDSQLAMGDPQAARKSWQRAYLIHQGTDVAFRLNRQYWGVEEIQALAPDKPRLDSALPLQSSPTLTPGEVLRYKVKYLMFHLGTLVVENLGRFRHQGLWVHRIRFTVKSAGLGSLLHIDSEFESWIAERGVFTLRQRNLQSDSASGDGASQFEMDLEKGVCVVRRTDGLYLDFDKVSLPTRPQDGVSVFQLAREMARRRENGSSLTMVDGAWKGTTITAGKTSTLKWDGRKRKVIQLDAFAHYKGPGGLSGRVRGWFSDDQKAIPYKSKMKILLGSVVFRLQPDSILDPQNQD